MLDCPGYAKTQTDFHVLRMCMTLQEFEKLLDLGSFSYWRSRRYSSTLILPPT
jgi:hypothetical protein